MFRCFYSLAALVFCYTMLPAQTTLFLPRNLQKAYDNGTRSWDGNPGPKYWQNRAQYTITAKLDPATRRLSGEETIKYFNNSPDTLNRLRIKLQHDRYRKGAQRAYDVTASDVSDEGMAIEMLEFNGQPVDEKNRRRNTTFLDIGLKDDPIPPGSTVELRVKWSYTLPAGEDAARDE